METGLKNHLMIRTHAVVSVWSEIISTGWLKTVLIQPNQISQGETENR